MSRALACIDMGTTRSKVAIFNAEGVVMASSSRAVPGLETWRGFQAFDVDAAVHGACAALKDAVASLDGHAAVEGIIVTGQRATVVAVDARGDAVGPAISWQDTSGDGLLMEFLDGFGRQRFSDTTGLPPSALWSLAKILRLRHEAPEVFGASCKIVLLHDYVLHRLGAGRYATDASNASVTGLMNLKTRTWSQEILAAIDVPESMLPEIVRSASVCGHLGGEAARSTDLQEGLPLMVGGGDQQCSTLGLGATESGEAGLCLGTAAIVSCLVEKAMPEAAGKFFCTAHVLDDRWVLEGIHNAFAGSLEWAGAVLGLRTVSERSESIQHSPPGARGVFFLPFLAGIGSPDYDAACAGTFVGLRATHTVADLMRSVYEGILFETRRMLDAVSESAAVGHLFVGGGFASGPMGQLLADVLNRRIDMTLNSESSLLGAAVLGWYGLGRYEDIAASLRSMGAGRYERVEPCDAGLYAERFEEYVRLVGKVRVVYARPSEG